MDQKSIEKFEQMTNLTYAPRGPCVDLIQKELKFELIAASANLGLAVFVVLLNWLYIYQNWKKYGNRIKKMRSRRKQINRHLSEKHASLAPTITEPLISERGPSSDLYAPDLTDLSMPAVTRTAEKKRTVKGFMASMDSLE